MGGACVLLQEVSRSESESEEMKSPASQMPWELSINNSVGPLIPEQFAYSAGSHFLLLSVTLLWLHLGSQKDAFLKFPNRDISQKCMQFRL